MQVSPAQPENLPKTSHQLFILSPTQPASGYHLTHLSPFPATGIPGNRHSGLRRYPKRCAGTHQPGNPARHFYWLISDKLTKIILFLNWSKIGRFFRLQHICGIDTFRPVICGEGFVGGSLLRNTLHYHRSGQLRLLASVCLRLPLNWQKIGEKSINHRFGVRLRWVTISEVEPDSRWPFPGIPGRLRRRKVIPQRGR